MQDDVIIDGEPVRLSPPPVIRNGTLWVPLYPLCQRVGAHVRELGEEGILVCRGDRCAPLTGDDETLTVDGVLFAPLRDIADPLGLSYRPQGDSVFHLDAGGGEVGAYGRAAPAVGEKAPPFTLPEVRTGKPISLESYRGKKTLIFAWASW